MSLVSVSMNLQILGTIGLPLIPSWEQLRPFIADLWLIATMVGVLLTPFFVRRNSASNTACALVTLAGLGLGLISLVLVTLSGGITGEQFSGMLVLDNVAILWKCLLLLFVIGVVLMWFAAVAPNMHEGDGPEFFTLLLGATLGMSLMASTSNLLMLVIAVEMASLPSYVLAGFRKTNTIGAEASLKYVLFGAATSAIMIYGLSILYGLYGTLQMEQIATQMAHSTAGGGGSLLIVSLLGLIVGIGFKISAVPFHFWCPDVFEGANIDVSAFLSVASKGAALTLLMRLLMLIAGAAGFDSGNQTLVALAIILGVLGAVTATVGNLGAFVQNNIKRLLAYSSIAHAGYMLCALSLLVKHDAPVVGIDGTNAAAQAILLYLAVYLFMNLGAFTVAAVIGRQTGSEDIRDYADMRRRSPLLAFCMSIFLFSLVGLPPLAGFAAKLNVMYVLGHNGGWWWALVAIIGLNTIFSLYYYVRVIRMMYLSSSDAPAFFPNPLGGAIAIGCAAMLVLMLIGWGPLNTLTTRYGKLYIGSLDHRAIDSLKTAAVSNDSMAK